MLRERSQYKNMKNFADLSLEEQHTYFNEAANEMGLTLDVVEKDFWVCWSLDQLFSHKEFRENFIFKGGTSLSKIYDVIQRFSEDIDLTINLKYINDHSSGTSEKSDKIRKRCANAIKDHILPELQRLFSMNCGHVSSKMIKLDPSDSDAGTVLFEFPQHEQHESYLLPNIKLEFGALGALTPTQSKTTTSYVAQTYPEAFTQPETNEINTLHINRTYWEKITILHSICHRPETKHLRPRMSRHYYDMYMLHNIEGLTKKCKSNPLLLADVVKNKQENFKESWDWYPTAQLGTIQLVPPKKHLEQLKQDYAAMEVMFFSSPPSFDEIIAGLTDLENIINASDQKT